MKSARLCFVLLLCVLGGGGWPVVSDAHAAQAAPAKYDFFGKGYVRLTDWARVNNFELHWLKAGDTLQINNHFWRFIFYKDSREAEFSGVHVCLSYPILVRDGVGYVSQVDLDTAIRPLLVPPKIPKGAKIKNIVIDPGHGGKDPGNLVGLQQEKKYTLLLAQELADQLRRVGFNVFLTRNTDVFVELPERPNIARRRGADLFLSVHWNQLPGNREMSGAQTFCMTPGGAASSNAGRSIIGAGPSPGNRNNEKNMLLAYSLQKSLLDNLHVEDRGVRRARYWVLRDASMPAVLIEGGFMSNPAEAKRIYDAGYRKQMARAIVEGVLAYQRQVE